MIGTVAIPLANWQMATEYPSSNISGTGLTTFGRLVRSYTAGRVTTTNAFDNELGISSGDLLHAANERRVAGGDAFAGPLEAIDPIFGLASLPFVAQSIEGARAINLKARPLYERALKALGLRLLYITIWPPTGLWSDRPLTGSDDLRWVKMRTYDYNSAEVMRLAGLEAEYLPFHDALARVKDGALNAILTSGDGAATSGLWDHLPHFTPITYAVPISIAFVRVDAFERLPQLVQDQVIKAASETEMQQFEALATRMSENLALMRSRGVNIPVAVDPSMIARLRAAANAPVAAWRTKVSAEAAAIIDRT